MLPAFLSCRLVQLPSLGAGAYRSISRFWADRAADVEEIGPFFSWRETTRVTFGESSWYGSIEPFRLNSRRAIGVLRSEQGRDLLAIVAPLPFVAKAIALALPKILQHVCGCEVHDDFRLARVRVGKLVAERYEVIGPSIHSLQTIQGSNGPVVHLHANPFSREALQVPEEVARGFAEPDDRNDAFEGTRRLLGFGMYWENRYIIIDQDGLQLSDIASNTEALVKILGTLAPLLDNSYLRMVEADDVVSHRLVAAAE